MIDRRTISRFWHRYIPREWLDAIELGKGGLEPNAYTRADRMAEGMRLLREMSQERRYWQRL